MTSAWFPETARDRRNAVNGFSIMVKNLLPGDLVYIHHHDNTLSEIRLIVDKTSKMILHWRTLLDGNSAKASFSVFTEWHVKHIVRNGIICGNYPELVAVTNSKKTT